MRRIELVFRTIGERTSKFALELAKQNIAPDKVHVIENVKPFSEAVNQMLRINFEADFVVFMDADCLILENMRPFLEHNQQAYVDCYVTDKFRGKIHTGVHITRIDVVRAMQQIRVNSDDERYILRPESRTRFFALSELNEGKAFKEFKIFHDFHQYYKDIFAKYALRELRSRTDYQRAKLGARMGAWNSDDLDYYVAQQAINYARKSINGTHSPGELAHFIASLPDISATKIEELNIVEKTSLTYNDIHRLINEEPPQLSYYENNYKIFGIGLSRTGTKSLTKALNLLGLNVVHYPIDEQTCNELLRGKCDFSILEDLDGITDITVAPFFAQLDKMYPNSKFILTIRDKERWLKGLERHWLDRDAFDSTPGKEVHMQIRRFLRAAVYGTYSFNRERMSYIYDRHYQSVIRYFQNRTGALLVIDVCSGEGWEPLCSFLNKPVLNEPFPVVERAAELNFVNESSFCFSGS